MSDCEYLNGDGTCGYKRCAWWEQDVECEPDGCSCYSPCDTDEDFEYYDVNVDEEEDGDERD